MPPTTMGFDGLMWISKAGLRERFLTAWEQLVDIATYLLIIAVIFLIARLVSKFLQGRVWRRVPIYEVTPATESLINNSIAVFFYALAFTLTLAFLGASWATLITAFSISTIAVVFGFQDLLKSMLGGAFLIFERPYEVGDRIKVRDNEGEVAEIGVRTTTLLTDENATVIIPNSLHLSEPIRNMDRETTVSTVIRVLGIDGDQVTIGQEIERALGVEPAIVGHVALSSNAQHPWVERMLESASKRVIKCKGRTRIEDPARMRARVILRADRSVSRATEAEAVRRLQDAFPGAVVDVRRSSLILDESRDVD